MQQVKNMMKYKPVIIALEATLQRAAEKMKENDCGFLPVGTEDRIEGIITDRDIVIRAIAAGKNPAKEKVSDYMTAEVCSCAEGDTLEEAAGVMNENNVSRLVVLDDGEKITGVLTFGKIIRTNDDRKETASVVDCAVGKKAA